MINRPPPPSDLGVVLYATSDGSGTYVDPRGNASGAPNALVRTLTASNWIASEWFTVGATGRLFVVVKGVISVGLASVAVAVERQALEPNNDAGTEGSYFNPSIVSTVRGDYPASGAAATQTIQRADLLRGDGTGANQVAAFATVGAALASAAAEVLDVTLQTTDHVISGRCRALLKCTNAPQAGDKIAIAVFVGGAP